MKTQYNKSQIMKRAWSLYKGEMGYTFSESLIRSWEIEKSNIESSKMQAEIADEKNVLGLCDSTIGEMSGCAEWYRTAPSGTYFGD